MLRSGANGCPCAQKRIAFNHLLRTHRPVAVGALWAFFEVVETADSEMRLPGAGGALTFRRLMRPSPRWLPGPADASRRSSLVQCRRPAIRDQVPVLIRLVRPDRHFVRSGGLTSFVFCGC